LNVYDFFLTTDWADSTGLRCFFESKLKKSV
jgi:hypothetical protein